MGKIRHIALLFLIIVFMAQLGVAEFICRSDIIYFWRSSSDNEDVKREVIFDKAEYIGSNKERAEEGLKILIASELKKAQLECKRKHENLTGCISSKFSSITPVLSHLGFEAKKDVEQAVVNDCKLQTGKCLEVKASMIKCIELKEQSGGGAEKGDAVEDKKKKK